MTMTTPPLRWLRDAVARKALADHFCMFHFQAGGAAATDGALSAWHPLPMSVPTCAVRGEHIEAGAKALDGVPEFNLDDSGRLVIKGGRTKISMPADLNNTWTSREPEGTWRPVPPGLVEALTELLPFAGDGQDNTGVSGAVNVADGHLWATDKTIVARTRVALAVDDVDVLLPRAVVEFIIARGEGLTEWCLTDNRVGFRWENGAWMHSATLTAPWPIDMARRLLNDQTPDLCTFEITETWRQSLDRLLSAAGTTSTFVVLRNEALSSETGSLFIETEADNMLPEGMLATNWHANGLARMAAVALAWNPARMPAPFTGRSVMGALVRVAMSGSNSA